MDTRSEPALQEDQGDQSPALALTILLHPDPDRVGQVALLEPLVAGRAVALSRTEPLFSAPSGGEPWALADPFLSRRPMLIEPAGDGFVITRAPDAIRVSCAGAPLDGRREVTRGDVERGLLLELGTRVVLLFHFADRERLPAPDDWGLIGDSSRIHEVRRSILAIRDRDTPVLLRGETGTGKEVVAHAIHRTSPRRDAEFLSVNMAALAPSVAISELFGHSKGAFTGATDHRAGFFARAHGGTLFLDEIGEAPVEVQVMLLRALETGKIQPIGARSDEDADVRLIAATDADLETAAAEGRFRAALLHRLAAFTIELPPLRDRIEDLGRLFFHFLRQELSISGEQHRLRAVEGDAQPYVPAAVITRLARYDWPGNVRQLRNVIRQLVISSQGSAALKIGPSVDRLLDPAAEERSPDAGGVAGCGTSAEDRNAPRRAAEEPVPKSRPSELTEDMLIEALRANRWSIEPAAKSLGISRPTLYALIDNSSRIRKAKDIPEDELERSYDALGGDIDAMAEALQVSSRGLKRRLRELSFRR